MKTLKQILNSKQIYPFASPPTAKFIDDEITKAVKEWLTEHRKDIGNQIYSDHRVVAEAVFDVLLQNCDIEKQKVKP